MSEYKFRGKRLDNGEWVYGNLILSLDADESFKSIIIPIENSDMFTSDYNGDLGFEKWFKIEENTVCKYTGKNDVEGHEIYGNDILQFLDTNRKFIVKWDDSLCRFALFNMDGRYYALIPEVSMKYLKKIGNTFDNPELLSLNPCDINGCSF